MSESNQLFAMQSVAFSHSERGLRVQINYQGGLVAEPETISAVVLVPRSNVTLRELQEQAARRSIELLQHFLDHPPPQGGDTQ